MLFTVWLYITSPESGYKSCCSQSGFILRRRESGYKPCCSQSGYMLRRRESGYKPCCSQSGYNAMGESTRNKATGVIIVTAEQPSRKICRSFGPFLLLIFLNHTSVKTAPLFSLFVLSRTYEDSSTCPDLYPKCAPRRQEATTAFQHFYEGLFLRPYLHFQFEMPIFIGSRVSDKYLALKLVCILSLIHI